MPTHSAFPIWALLMVKDFILTFLTVTMVKCFYAIYACTVHVHIRNEQFVANGLNATLHFDSVMSKNLSLHGISSIGHEASKYDVHAKCFVKDATTILQEK